MMAFLTSSFMSNLHFTPEEESATLMIEKERAQRAVGKHAAAFLQTWYRLKHANGDARTRKGDKMRREVRKMRAEFKRIQQITSVDFDDLCADTVKIDQIAVRSKHLMKAVEVLHHHTEPALLSIGHGPDRASALLPQRPELPLSTSNTEEALSALLPQRPENIEESSLFERRPSFERAAWNAAERKVLKEEADVIVKTLGWKRDGAQGKRKDASMQWRMDQVKTRCLTRSLSSHLRDKDQTGDRAQDFGDILMQGLYVERNPSLRWRFNRRSVEQRMRQSDMYAAVAGLTGMCVSIFINELMVLGYESGSHIMLGLKIANSAMTLATIICLYQVFRVRGGGDDVY